MNINRRISRPSNGVHLLMALFAIAVIAIGVFFAFNPSRHATCTVTGTAYSWAVDKDQQHNIINTSCGDFGFTQSGMGATGPSRIKVGHTYDFGYHGWHVAWSKPTILTWREINSPK